MGPMVSVETSLMVNATIVRDGSEKIQKQFDSEINFHEAHYLDMFFLAYNNNHRYKFSKMRQYIIRKIYKFS